MTSVFSKASPIRPQQDEVETAVFFAVYDTVEMTDGNQAGNRPTYQLYVRCWRGRGGYVRELTHYSIGYTSQVALRPSFNTYTYFFLMQVKPTPFFWSRLEYTERMHPRRAGGRKIVGG